MSSVTHSVHPRSRRFLNLVSSRQTTETYCDRVTVVAVNGSPSSTSSTAALANAALDVAGGGVLVNVADLDADALLLRGEHASVRDALHAISGASILVLATPVYRATFSGLLKLVLDQLPPDGLRGIPVVLIATAGSDLHFLALDTGGRAVVASLGGWTVPTVVYATPASFVDRVPTEETVGVLRSALAEAVSLRAAIRSRTEI
jgi:FMN reductase